MWTPRRTEQTFLTDLYNEHVYSDLFKERVPGLHDGEYNSEEPGHKNFPEGPVSPVPPSGGIVVLKFESVGVET